MEIPPRRKHDLPQSSTEREAVDDAKGSIALLLRQGAVDDPKGRLHLHKGKTPKGSEKGDTRTAFSRERAFGGEQDREGRSALQKGRVFQHPAVKHARATLHAAIRAKKDRMKDPKEKAERKAKRAASEKYVEPKRDPMLKGAPWGY